MPFSGLLHFISTPKSLPWRTSSIFHPHTFINFFVFLLFLYFQPFPETKTDETTTNGDVKVNGTESDSKASPATSQKYSQILGDLHTNNSHQFSRNSSSNNIYKSRGYNNKENFYNQRGRPGVQRSWQRGASYRTPIVGTKSDENDKAGSSDAKVTEPIKFNEGEMENMLP